MTVLAQDYGLVETVLKGFGLGQGRVDVGAADLGPSRGGIVIDPAPGGDHAAQCAGALVVLAEGLGVNEEAVGEVVQPDPDFLGGLVDQGPNVGVGPKLVAAQQLDAGLDQLLR